MVPEVRSRTESVEAWPVSITIYGDRTDGNRYADEGTGRDMADSI